MNFANIGKAAEAAYGRIDKVVGNDPDLDLYEKITPQALEKLSELYGASKVNDYVRTMEERRRVRNGRK